MLICVWTRVCRVGAVTGVKLCRTCFLIVACLQTSLLMTCWPSWAMAAFPQGMTCISLPLRSPRSIIWTTECGVLNWAYSGPLSSVELGWMARLTTLCLSMVQTLVLAPHRRLTLSIQP